MLQSATVYQLEEFILAHSGIVTVEKQQQKFLTDANETGFSNKKHGIFWPMQKKIFGFDMFSDLHWFCSQFNTNMVCLTTIWSEISEL